MLAHPSGTLIGHRLADIISPQPNSTGHRPIFVGSLCSFLFGFILVAISSLKESDRTVEGALL